MKTKGKTLLHGHPKTEELKKII